MAREVSARRELLLLAIVVAAVSGLVPYLPNVEKAEAGDLRTVAPVVAALSYGWLLAILFGATFVGRDLADGRLGFFFSRPLSGRAIWSGKMAAAIFLIWLCEIIVLLPSLYDLGLYHFVTSEGIGQTVPIGLIVMPLLLLLVSHAVGVMARARTAWLFLDVAGVVVATVFAWLILRPMLFIGAEIALWVVAGGLVLALLIALSFGGAVGVSVGRVDLERTHAATSLALWGTLAVFVAAITLYGGWLRNFGPHDFDDVGVITVSPDGNWVEAVGQARNRLDVRRRCLISTTDDLWIPVARPLGRYQRGVAYSVDGSTALWRGAGGKTVDEPRALWWADLGRRDPSARQTNLVVASDALLALSASGDRLAILEEGILSVYALEEEHLLTAVRLPDGFDRVTVMFPSEENLRLFVRVGRGDGQSLLIVNVVVSTGEILPTGKIQGLGEQTALTVDGGLQHLVVRTRFGDGLVAKRSIHDANDGSFIRELTTSGFPWFLRDGRIVIWSEDERTGTSLVVESVEGGDRVVQSISAMGEPRLGGEAVPNGIIVSRLEDPADRSQGLRIDLMDVDTGEVRNVGRHLRRAFPWFAWQYGSGGGVLWFSGQPAASRLFLDQTGALMRWNPETGGLAHVVGGVSQ
jgi:hypothetical protein